MNKKPLIAAGTIALAAAIAVPLALDAHERGNRGAMMMQGGHAFDFTEVDRDGDGKITEEEFAAHREAQVTGIDQDGDNLISAEELAAQMRARMEARIARMVERRMDARDVDGDGFLSAAEMMAPPMANRMFAGADADGDGAVTEAEMSALHDRMAERMARGHGKHRHGHGEKPIWDDTTEDQ